MSDSVSQKLAAAISASSAEIIGLHTTLHAAHARANKLADVRARLADLAAFPPGTPSAIPDHPRKLAAAQADLQDLFKG